MIPKQFRGLFTKQVDFRFLCEVSDPGLLALVESGQLFINCNYFFLVPSTFASSIEDKNFF